MSERTPRRALIAAAPAAVVSVLLIVTAYLFVGDVDLNLADEGYLWYGTLRTAEGQVPLRDFQSYEPGRYLWCAAWSFLLGNGILALRLSLAIFQATGLFCGLLVVRRVVSSSWLLVPAGIVLLAWMFPVHKVFESSITMIAVYAAVRLLEDPGIRQHFLSGALVGLTGFVGKNHAFYTALGFLLLMALLAFKLRQPSPLRKLGVWCGGVVVGYSPMLLMLIFVDGFASSFADTIHVIVRYGADLPLPYPWPWRLRYRGLGVHGLLLSVGIGLSFALPAVVYSLGLAMAWLTGPKRIRKQRVLTACSFMGVFYIYHAAVRSDVWHLAQCIHPALLALFAIPPALGYVKRNALSILTWALPAALTLPVVFEHNHALMGLPLRNKPVSLVAHEVAGDRLRMDAGKAAYLGQVEATVERYVRPEEPIFIGPMVPTLYPLLGKKSPVWEIYAFWPDIGREPQERMIRNLTEQQVNWVLLVDTTIDGRTDLFFRNSHPLVWRYLVEHFAVVPTPELPRDHYLLRRARPTGPAPGWRPGRLP